MSTVWSLTDFWFLEETKNLCVCSKVELCVTVRYPLGENN